jgi:hypothetical protein
LEEVAFQLKAALLLIPMEEIIPGKISSNVFYDFYWFLRESELLPPEDDSFAGWMLDWFEMTADDACDPNYNLIASGVLRKALSDPLLQIAVFSIGQDDRFDDSMEMLEQIISNSHIRRVRSFLAMKADAKMMCHLCDPNEQVVEPFFLTWDRHFSPFRKAFVDKYDRSSVHSFHLFNPAKFTNHISLINLKVDPQSLATDFLTLVDGFEKHERALTVWDEVNKLLSIDFLDRKTRSNYTKRIRTLFEVDFGYSEDDLANKELAARIAEPLDKIIFAINEHYNSGRELRMIHYRDLFKTNETFEKVKTLIFGTIKNDGRLEDLLLGLDNLIIEKRNSKVTN